MRDVDYVVHAAALKQVPIAEYNPFECIRTNVFGAENVVYAALRRNVRKVIALSTDKAANPVNLYGASKLAVRQDLRRREQSRRRRRHALRGRALRQRRGLARIACFPSSRSWPRRAPTSLPITDERMTRFWITLTQGVNFVLSSMEMMRGGEIFVPKIPSTTIAETRAARRAESEAAQGRRASRREAARDHDPGRRFALDRRDSTIATSSSRASPRPRARPISIAAPSRSPKISNIRATPIRSSSGRTRLAGPARPGVRLSVSRRTPRSRTALASNPLSQGADASLPPLWASAHRGRRRRGRRRSAARRFSHHRPAGRDLRAKRSHGSSARDDTIACSNGTAALYIAARALGLGAGHTVIVPAITFLATASAPHLAGAEIVFADVDPETGLMRACDLEEALARAPHGRADAVFPVHYAGPSCDMAADRRQSRAHTA